MQRMIMMLLLMMGADRTDDVQLGISDARLSEWNGDEVKSGKNNAIGQRAAEPRRRCGPKKPEPAAAAPKRRREDSTRNQGTQKTKRPNCRGSK